MNEQDRTSTLEKSNRGVSLWLALSLAANALLVGVVGGKMLGEDGHVEQDRPRLQDFQRDMRDRALSSIDSERRRELRRAMRRIWIDSAPTREQLENARDAAIAVGEADPYDVEAMKTSLKDIRQAESELRRQAHEAIADILADVSPEERREVIRMFSGLGPMGDRRIQDREHRRPGFHGPRDRNGENRRGSPPRPNGESHPDKPPPGSDDAG